jgi:hypothetical protein
MASHFLVSFELAIRTRPFGISTSLIIDARYPIDRRRLPVVCRHQTRQRQEDSWLGIAGVFGMAEEREIREEPAFIGGLAISFLLFIDNYCLKKMAFGAFKVAYG